MRESLGGSACGGASKGMRTGFGGGLGRELEVVESERECGGRERPKGVPMGPRGSVLGSGGEVGGVGAEA